MRCYSGGTSAATLSSSSRVLFFVVATGNESVCQDAAHGLDSAFSRLAKAQNSFAKAHEKAWQRRATY